MSPAKYLCAAFGVAPLLALFRRDGAAILFESVSGSPYESRMGYFLFLGLACLASCLWAYACTHHPKARLYSQDPRPIVGLSIAATVASETFMGLGGIDTAHMAGAFGVCLLYAAWIGIVAPAWGTALARCGRTAIMVSAVLALLVSLLPSTLGACIEGVLKPLVGLGPLTSGVLLVLGFRTRTAKKPPIAEESPADSPSEPIPAELQRLPLFFSALVLLGGVIRGFLNNGTFINSHNPANNLITHAISAALMICIVFIATRPKHAGLGLRRAGASLFIFLLGSLLLIAFLSVELVPMLPLGRSLVIAGNTCLTVLFWILLVCTLRDRPDQSTRWMGQYVIVEALGSICSYLLTPAFAQYLGISLENQVFGCSLATAFVLALAAFAFLGTGSTQDASRERSPLKACQELAPRYGLTEREVQICALVAQGNTLDAVADHLGLSAHTVRSYSKDLYRKLGVHKKQEVVDLVARTMSE